MREVLRVLGAVMVSCLVGVCAGCAGSEGPSAACAPSCDARQCGDDGCGGTCGACPAGDVCAADGSCKAADSCELSCGELQWECGEHCGVSCGACEEGLGCADGRCQCLPDCRGKACGDEDGCGGECSPCASDESCADCVLRAYVVEREVVAGDLAYVTIAVDYNPPTGATLPGIADLRLTISGPATLDGIGLGSAPVEAGKELHIDATTGRPYRLRPDGSVQALVLSPRSKDSLGAGRWLVYRFKLGTPERPAWVPVAFSLVDREGILAPVEADQALWGTPLSSPVVVWPEVSGAN